MIRSLYVLLFAAIAGLVSCTSTLRPTEPQHAWVRSHYGTDKDIDKGYTLFIANCSGCHSLPRPSAYSDSTWAVVFPEMREKSKLSDHDADLVLAYISSASALAKAH